MASLFYRPTGFQDDMEEQKKIEKILEIKNRALKEIDDIDNNPYTDSSLARRDELVQTVRDCIGIMNQSSYRVKELGSNNRLTKTNIGNNPTEFLQMLYEKNSIEKNMEKDKKSIQEFIDAKRSNKYKNFMYEESKAKNNVNPLEVQYAVDSTKSSDAFIISNTGNPPEKDSYVNYRITLRNSDSLRQEDVLEFIKTFKKEAEKRNTYIRCKVLFEQSDGIIFYADKNNLLETVRILEDLKDEEEYGSKVTNAIKSFGNPQPFAATVDDSSYYSIAMHGVESNTTLKSTLGGGLVKTFNSYMDSSLETIYNDLLPKCGNDASKINVDEFYRSLVARHQERMNTGEIIPLWMNNRMYDDLDSNKLAR